MTTSILLMVTILIIALQFSSVQTFLTRKVAQYLSDELNSTITLDRIYFKPFSSLSLQNFLILDESGKKIVATESLDAKINLLQFLNNKLVIEEFVINSGFINFEIFKDSTNFDKFIQYFTSSKKETSKKSTKLELQLGRIVLKNNEFVFRDHKYKGPKKGVNFSNLRLYDLSMDIKDIQLDSVYSATIEGLRLKEKSGFEIKQLNTKASYSSKQMIFKELDLQTNSSNLSNYLSFSYNQIGDFTDFLEKIHIESNLTNTFIDSRDIEYFAPDISKVIFDAHIKSALVSGSVSKLKAKNIDLTTSKNTNFIGDVSITGIPNMDKTIFDISVSKLKTSASDIEHLVNDLSNQKKFELPEQIHALEDITFEGNFKGLYHLFDVNGNFNTSLGKLKSTSHINLKSSISYKGNIATSNFDIGKLVNVDKIKTVNFDLNFDGKNLKPKELNLVFDGKINHLQSQLYTYNNIQINGNIADAKLAILGDIQDANLNLDYKATVDWQDNNTNYSLNTNLRFANLKNLKWIEKDSVILQRATINTNLIGNTLNNIEGYLKADSIALSTSKGHFEINKLNFLAEGNEKERALNLSSDVLDASVTGVIDLNTIIPYFKSLAMRYAPAIGFDIQTYNPQNFDLQVNVKSFKPIAPLIDAELSLEDGAHLNANFSSENFSANFMAFTPSVVYKGIKLQNLAIQENADQHAFSLNILADRINFSDSIYVNNINIKNTLAKDSLNFKIQLSEKKATNYLDLNGNIHFAHNAPAFIKFNPSEIIINKDFWNLNDNALLRVSKGKIYISNLILSQEIQKLTLNGILSNEDDKINIDFNQFNLASLHGITNPLGINLNGFMNGNIELSSLFKNPYASANIHTTAINYNNLSIGKLNLLADFDPANGLLNVDMDLLDENNRGILFDGKYNFYDDNESLDLNGHLKETDLALFQPFLKNLVSNIDGKANAEFKLTGTLKNPKITGTSRLSNTSFTVNYLKTHYQLDNQFALIENNAIILQNLQIQDLKGHKATANGIVNLQQLSNPYIDIDVVGNNFMILNTTFKDNNLYYGTAYATGTFRFKGYTSAIDIDIAAQSENGTVINIPFNSAMTVSDSDFIYFLSKDSTENLKRDRKSLFRGLTMNMDLKLLPNAEVNLQTSLGSLRGNGQGEILMKISSLGDFEMFGDYNVSQGKFHFTAQDFINKYFDIKQGGSIRWSGNPSEANVNINAIYQQRTSVAPLYNAAGREAENERVLAQSDMIIKGTLGQPDITFDLNFPQNPYIKDQLQSYLSDVNNVNQQALSLIVRRSFTPSSTVEIGKEVNNTLLSAGTEIAFNQLNNIISESLNINFFDLNIRSFNDASASVRLLNDRLILTGGITDRTNYQATDLTFFSQGVATDAELTYRLRKDGNLLFRAYNRPYTRNFLIRATDAEYISALGLVYRQEFNSFYEFWKKMWWWGYKKENKN